MGFIFDDGVICNLRIFLGAMASAPLWARKAMTILKGKEYHPGLLLGAAERITSETRVVRNHGDSPGQRRAPDPNDNAIVTQLLFKKMVLAAQKFLAFLPVQL